MVLWATCPPDVSPRGCSDLNSPKRVARPPTTTVTAMGGENAESPVAVTEGCPAFADGCPYGKNVEVADWIKASAALMNTCPEQPKTWLLIVPLQR